MEEFAYFKTTAKDGEIHRMHEVLLNREENKILSLNIYDLPDNHELDRPQLPPILKKYYSCEETSVDALRGHFLWASYPKSFPDRFDCSPEFWEEKWFNAEEFSEDFFRYFYYSDNSKQSQQTIRDSFIERILEFIGIVCLNAGGGEDQFWEHFSSKSTGFVIEFDAEKLTQDFHQKPFNIDYCNNMQDQKLHYNKNYFLAEALRWVTIKKKDLKHENEWRYIFFDIPLTLDPVKCPAKERKREYNPKSINKIILGCEFFKEEYLNEEPEYFRVYDLNYESDCCKKEMVSYLIENQNLPLYWNFINENTMELQEVKIRLSGISWNKVGIEILFNE
jgi:hypothetical protein